MVLSYIQLGVLALVLCLNTSVDAGICGKLHLKGLCRLLTHSRNCGKGNMRGPCMIPPQYDLTDQGEATNQSDEAPSQSGEASHESNQEPTDQDEDPTDMNDYPIETDDNFCDIKCREGGVDLLTSLCVCVTTSTKIATTRTTIPPTTTERPTTPVTTETPTTKEVPTTTTEGPTTFTTPQPETCYYTRNRPAQLGAIVKRMYSGSDVLTECEYPGVVGLFNASKVFQCMGTLLEEDVILIDSLCFSIANNPNTGALYALVGSYQQADVTTNLPYLIVSSAKYLDTTGTFTKLYTISLSSPVTFDDRCVQPACVPNTHLYVADIDETDCRIVGYGNTADTLPSTSPTLQEVKVTLNLNTINGPIRYTRQDGLGANTGPCFGDQGAPLICRHKATDEWITIGITISIGYPCSTGKSVVPYAASLVNTILRTALLNYKYVPA
ncbi:acrosin-like [Physella acuta]|uniref:acrosin-like n=1 Tax=Physella acuta TaxID=109671 RepID=UPI0027DDB824|nr:acrosin-like [Physella acuta]